MAVKRSSRPCRSRALLRFLERIRQCQPRGGGAVRHAISGHRHRAAVWRRGSCIVVGVDGRAEGRALPWGSRSARGRLIDRTQTTPPWRQQAASLADWRRWASRKHACCKLVWLLPAVGRPLRALGCPHFRDALLVSLRAPQETERLVADPGARLAGWQPSGLRIWAHRARPRPPTRGERAVRTCHRSSFFGRCRSRVWCSCSARRRREAARGQPAVL